MSDAYNKINPIIQSLPKLWFVSVLSPYWVPFIRYFYFILHEAITLKRQKYKRLYIRIDLHNKEYIWVFSTHIRSSWHACEWTVDLAFSVLNMETLSFKGWNGTLALEIYFSIICEHCTTFCFQILPEKKKIKHRTPNRNLKNLFNKVDVYYRVEPNCKRVIFEIS